MNLEQISKKVAKSGYKDVFELMGDVESEFKIVDLYNSTEDKFNPMVGYPVILDCHPLLGQILDDVDDQIPKITDLN